MNELRPYQREDCEVIKRYKRFGVFNQQRTGKTPTSIRAFSERGIRQYVVICPASAQYQWAREIKLWSNVEPIICIGSPEKKKKLVQEWKEKKTVLIISYGSFKQTKTNEGLVDLILKCKPEGVILDEAHRIKDRKSANALSAFKMTKVPIRLALTGTPAPNKPDEIWSILHFLFPDQFRSYWKFVNEYMRVSEIFGHGRTFKVIEGIRPDKKQEFAKLLSQISIQRKREEIMDWLPAKEYQRVYLPPTKEQLRYLDELKNYFETDDVVVSGILDRLIRYRQICLDPELINLKSKSPKTDWILDYTNDYPERPTIIFSKFTKYINKLSSKLKCKHAVIVGDTPIKKRNEYVQAFQNGDINLLLINIDAGKEALTLDRAEAIIFTDKFPPVGDIEQAEDRFVATTKDRANKPHVIYELVMEGTYDEQLYKLINKRAANVDAINDFKKYMKGVTNGKQ